MACPLLQTAMGQGIDLYRPGVFSFAPRCLGSLNPAKGCFLGGIQGVNNLPINSDLVLRGFHGFLACNQGNSMLCSCQHEKREIFSWLAKCMIDDIERYR